MAAARSFSIRTEDGDVSAGAETVILKGSTLDSDLRAFKKRVWRTKELADFTLKASGKYFKVHKTFIASHMAYFPIDSSELSQDSAIIDMDAGVLELILKYLYEGALEVTKDSIPKLKNGAGYLGFQSLYNQCRYAALLGVDLIPSNCLDVWSIALDVEDQIMATQALQAAVHNFCDIQNDDEFTHLPVVCLLQLLSHPDLKVQSPDERLGAVMTWLTHDPDTRQEYLPTILDLLSLEDMQDWHLKQVLRHPAVKASKKACTKLRNALESKTRASQGHQGRDVACGYTTPKKQITKEEPQKRRRSHHLGMQQSQGTCWVTAGMLPVKDGMPQSPSDRVYSMSLQGDMCMRRVGVLQATVDSSVISMCCAEGGDIYIGGLGKDWAELWRFNLHTQEQACVGRLIQGRYRHAMCYRHGRIYILGGLIDCLFKTSSIEIFNLRSGSITDGGCLHNGGPVTCHGVGNTDWILVGGAWDTQEQPVAQLYSVTKRAVTHKISLGWVKAVDYPIGIVAVNSDNFLLFGNGYTAALTLDITHGRITYVKNLNRYLVPNTRCGVAKSADGNHVILFGGEPKSSGPNCFIYKALVKDILQNTPQGWEKVAAAWTLGKCIINSQTTFTAP